MKKVFAIIIVLVINNVWAKSKTIDGITWTYMLDNDGRVSIGSNIANATAVPTSTKGSIVIPVAIDGYPVTAIRSRAFRGCSKIKSVTIPTSVTSIGGDAFYECSSLTSIVIPEGVTSIGSYAFYGCSSLSSVTISGNLNSIGVGAFCDCNALGSVYIEDLSKWCAIDFADASANPLSSGTQYFNTTGGHLYLNGKELIHAIIPEDVTSIKSFAFLKCRGLVSATIHSNVTKIEDYAFYGCSELTSVTMPESVTSIGDYAFYRCSQLSSIIIPEGVMSIGEEAFYSCSGLTSITIPNGVQSIGRRAFLWCSGLTMVKIPASITSIGESAFRSCQGLISVDIPDDVKSIGPDVLTGCNKLQEIVGWRPGLPTNVERIVISSSVKEIGGLIFQGCEALRSIIIPSSVIAIGNNAFSGCTNIVEISFSNNIRSFGDNDLRGVITYTDTEGLSIKDGWVIGYCGQAPDVVDIPENVIGIASYAFEGQTCLKKINLPSSLKYIGVKAFMNCDRVTEMKFPEGLEKIDNEAFGGCDALSFVEICGCATVTGDDVFASCNDTLEVVGWQPNIRVVAATKIIVQDGITLIGDRAFSDYALLESITIPDNVKSVGSEVLFGCEGLKEIIGWRPGMRANVERIVVSSSVSEIGGSTFSGCNVLMSLSIPNSVAVIGDNAFSGCTGLAQISLPEGLRNLGDNDLHQIAACADAQGLVVQDGWVLGYSGTAPEIVTIPEGVVGIASHAFEGQTDIGMVHLPKSLKYIGVKAFRNCTWLQDLNLPVGLEKIDVAAFENCTSLDHLVCPEGLLEIGADAFKDCWRMLSVSLPASLGLIGSNAFSGCTSLVGATLPAHIRPVSEVLPDVYGNLTEIIIAEGSTKVCENAFVGCVALTSVVVPGSVISIDTGAFRGCEYLGAISFKPGLVRIGTEAFKGCVRLSAVEFPDTLEEIGVGAFKECNRLTSVTFSDGLCKIDDSAFYGASGIVSLKFPQPLRSIGSKAFYGLQNLRSIQFADGLVEIGAEAFKGCGCLPSVEFPEGLETIGDSAFYESAGISSLKFPKSLRSIGANAFYGLQDLKSVEIPEGVSEVGAGAFANCANIQEVSMPVGAWTVEGVFTTAYNKISSVQVVGAPTTLPDGFLRNCSAIKEFEIPKTIQTIGVEAFKGTALLAINLPSGLKSIGASAFYGLTAPSVLILPEGLEVIGGSAFYGCSSITEVEIPMGIEHLEASTFAMCTKLVKVALPASLTSINGSAFSNDAAIRSVSIPGNLGTLKTIFPNAYDKISEVTIDESSSGLCESFMDGCKSVLAVGVPAGVKTIGKNAFRNCAALESFALPTGVTTISEGIFSGCTRLSSIVFPSEVISLGANIFNGCTALASVYFLGSAPNVDVNVYSGTPTTLTTYVVKGSVEWDGIPNSKALPKAWPTTNGRTITYWEPNVFDVTFFGNGGTPESQIVSETTGTTYIMPQENPSRVGATFAGWWTEPVNGGQVKGTMRVDLTRPHSFYAHWRFNRYTVRFEANGADGEMPTLAMTVDEPMNLPSSGFVRVDHDFVGWALEPEGEVVFTDGAEVINLSMEDGETVRLYAVWTEREWSAADYLGAKGLVFTSDGDAVWFPDAGTSHDGIGSMRSGEIGIADEGESTRSTLRTTVAGNGTLTFWWKVNCEGPDPDYGDLYDYLEFTIDGVRPAAVEPIAGDVDWMEVEVRIEGAMPTHELAWSFVKDDWDEEALPDVAWVDELIWTPDTVTVSFDGNGATNGDVPSAMALVAGSELVLPEAGTLHKRTCKFGGWTDGSKTYAAGETYIVGAADVMFSAVWIEFTIADALNASELVFTTDGDAVWTVDFETSHDGEASVRSGVVGTSQESWIETKVDGAGTLTFVWKADGFVYRNNPANYVQYVVDGGETVKVAVCDWTEVEIEVTGAGEHTVRWSYSHTRSQTSGGDCAWLDEVGWVATEVPLSPTIEGDEGATVTGDAETGFVIKPSEGKTAVEVTIPQGVDAAKVTVEVSPKVASVKPNGAKVKIVSGGADITEFLNVPAVDGSGVVDLTKATVKEVIVKEAMDPAKGAVIDLSGGPLRTTGPTITTAPTRKGLFYQFREGEMLGGMKDGDSIVGDGEPWTPNITVKGGNSAFYSIGVGKGE